MSMFSWFRNVFASGDVVGRDKITNNVLPHPRQLDLLSEKFRDEVASNSTTTEIIDELHHYNSSVSDDRDLTKILTEAGFGYLIDEAEELKQLIAMLIVKYQHYKSAQKIITYLLAEVESVFNATIKPKLPSVESESELKCILREFLVIEIQDKLGDNVLDIFNRQINGMVFFLTGNCHLEWN
jgi:hypothetical protein